MPRAYGLNRWLTFGASAFWHGFYSGYYLGFFTVPLMQDSVRSLYEAGGPALQYLGLSWIGVPAHTPTFAAVVLVEFVAIHLAWAYILVPFCLFEAHKGLAVWRSVGYAGHLIPLAYFLLAAVLRRLFPQAPLPGKSKGQVGKDKEKVKGAEGDAAKPAQGGSDGPAPTGAVEVEREPARPSMRLPKAHGRPGSTSPSPRLVSATSPRSPKLGSPRAASPNAAKKRR